MSCRNEAVVCASTPALHFPDRTVCRAETDDPGRVWRS